MKKQKFLSKMIALSITLGTTFAATHAAWAAGPTIAAGGTDTTNSVAAGYFNGATKDYALAFGVGNHAWNEYASAFGYGNTASGLASSAFGFYNSASSSYASAVGYQNKANGSKSSAFGYQNTAYTANSVALGTWSVAGLENSTDAIYALAIGAGDENFKTVASGKYSAAIGYNSTASMEGAMAVGYQNTASGLASTAIGYLNTASGLVSTAIGYWNTSSGIWSSSFGYNNRATAQQASAFGYGNTAFDLRASALGFINEAYTKYSLAVGSYAVAGNRDLAENPDKPGDFIYVPGDAISAISISSSNEFTHTSATAKYSTAIGFNTMASMEGAMAVGYQNTATGEKSSAFGYENIAYTDNSVALGTWSVAGDLVDSGERDNNNDPIMRPGNATNAIAIGAGDENNKTVAGGKYSTAIGYKATASGSHSIALGFDNTASGRASLAIGYSNTASINDASAIGYKNTASGIDSSAFGYSNTASGSSSLAMGKNNKAQGYYSSAVGFENTASAYYATAIGYKNKAYSVNSVALGDWAEAGLQDSDDKTASANAIAIGAGDEEHKTIASGKKSLAIGYNSTATEENSVAIGSESIAGALPIPVEYTYMGTKISDSFAGKTPLAVLSVGSEGSERLITNVAAGRITATSTDAINGSQLWYVADSINSRINDVIAGMPVVDAGNNTKVEVNSEPLPEEPPILKTGAAPVEPEPEQSSPRKEPAEVLKNTYTVSAWDTTVAAAAGEQNIMVTPTIDETGMTRDYKLALNKDLVVDSVTATDITATNGTIDNITAKDIQTDTLTAKDITAANATVDNITANVVKVGGNVTIDNKGMSIAGGPSVTTEGVDAGGKKITNVAAGTSATDAVNLGQLTNVENNMGNMITHVSDRVDRVGATAAALAALHPLPEEVGEKLSVAVGTGTYRDKYAGAVGMFYRPTDRIMLSLGGSKSGSETLANIGMTFALDKNVTAAPSKAAMASEIKELKTENASMKDKLAAQDAKLAAQDAEIAELKQLVQSMLKK